MKRVLALIVAVFMCASFVFAQEAAPAAAPAAPAAEATIAAEENDDMMPSFDFNMKFATRYLSHGRVCTPGNMMFYDASIALKGFYIGIWGAQDWNSDNTGDKIERYSFEEVDYYAGYGYTFEEVPVVNTLSVDLSVAYYDYPSRCQWERVNNQQYEWALAMNAGVFLNPGFKICWDPENELVYGNLNAGYDYSLKDLGLEMATLKTGCELWWANDRTMNGYDGKDHGKLGHSRGGWGKNDKNNFVTLATLCWTTSVDFALTENITLSPFMQLAFAVDRNVRSDWKDHGNANHASGINNQFGLKLDFAF